MNGFSILVDDDGLIHVNDGKILADFPNSYMNKTVLDFMFEMGEANKQSLNAIQLKLEKSNLDGMIYCGKVFRQLLEFSGKVMTACKITEYSIENDKEFENCVVLYIKGDQELVTLFWAKWEELMGE